MRESEREVKIEIAGPSHTCTSFSAILALCYSPLLLGRLLGIETTTIPTRPKIRKKHKKTSIPSAFNFGRPPFLGDIPSNASSLRSVLNEKKRKRENAIVIVWINKSCLVPCRW